MEENMIEEKIAEKEKANTEKTDLETFIKYLNQNEKGNKLLQGYAKAIKKKLEPNVENIEDNNNTEDVQNNFGIDFNSEAMNLDIVLSFRYNLVCKLCPHILDKNKVTIENCSLTSLKESLQEFEKKMEINVEELPNGNINNTNAKKSPRDKKYDIQKQLNKLVIPIDLERSIINALAMSKLLQKTKLEKFEPSTTIKNASELLESKNKKELASDHDFIKICKIMYRAFNNYGNQPYFNTVARNVVNYTSISACIQNNKEFFKAIGLIENIRDYFENIGNIKCSDQEFNDFLGFLGDAKGNLVVENGSVALKPCKCNEPLEIKSSNGIKKWLWIFGTGSGLGVLIAGGSAVNYFVVAFWPAAATKTVTILSMTIPGGSAVVCIFALVILFWKKHEQNQEKTIKNNLNGIKYSTENEEENKNKNIYDGKEDIDIEEGGYKNNNNINTLKGKIKVQNEEKEEEIIVIEEQKG